MKDTYKKSFEEGVKSSEIKSQKQLWLRVIIIGIIAYISFYNPFSILLRIFVFLLLMFILGLIGSSKKFRDKI